MMNGKKAVLSALVVLLLGAVLLSLNEFPLPGRWRQVAAGQLGRALGAPVTIGWVRIGFGGVTLHDVTVDGSWPMRVQRIVLGWSLRDLARSGDVLAATRYVELTGLEAVLPAGERTPANEGKESVQAPTEPAAEDGKEAGAQPPWAALLEAWPPHRVVEVRLVDGRIRGVDASIRGRGAVQGGTLSGRLEAARGGERLAAEGTVRLADGVLDVAVNAADLNLADYVPALVRWDIGGRADFFGTLTGTVADPLLRGTLASGGGRLFGQPFSSLQGDVELDRRRFAFARARVVQGTSLYFLDGHIAFPGGAGGTAAVELTLRTDGGRAETILGALGWKVPVEAGLAGTVMLRGPLGQVEAEGDVVLTHGVAYGQPFDRLTGRFRYADGHFAVEESSGRVREGVVHIRGGGPVQGSWELAVEAQNVPLQALRFIRERLPELSGVADFAGVVSGGAGGTPRAEGSVRGRYVTLGNWAFEDAEGTLAYDGEAFSLSGLRLQRRGGGTYSVAGRVGAGRTQAPLELTVAVEGESLGDLLVLLGAPPVPAAAGTVSAAAEVAGTVEAPTARIHIDARNVTVVGRRLGLGLTLHWAGGRVEVEQWARVAGSEPAAGEGTERQPGPS